jgi:hypothetical protein
MRKHIILVMLASMAGVGAPALAKADPPAPDAGQTPPKPKPSATAQPQPRPNTTAGTPRQANAEAEEAARKANEAVVGPSVQKQNEEAAANPSAAAEREKCPPGTKNCPPKSPQKKNERGDVGATSMQGGEPGAQVGQTAAGATNGIDHMVSDMTNATDKPGKYDPFAVEIDPLGLFVGGRLGFNLEWAPVVHHAFELRPSFNHTSDDIETTGGSTINQTFTGVGAELGYRYYTGHKGMNGVFVGPSFIAGLYNAGLPSGNQAFTDVGVAVDVGLQQVFFNHLVVGGGVGLEYLSVSHDFQDLPTGPGTIASSGVKPRFVLEIGYGL